MRLARIVVALIVGAGIFIAATQIVKPITGALSGASAVSSPTSGISETHLREDLCEAVVRAHQVVTSPSASEEDTKTAARAAYDAASKYVTSPAGAPSQLIGDMLRFTSDYHVGTAKAWKRDLKALLHSCRTAT